jgi:hypothetical protein
MTAQAARIRTPAASPGGSGRFGTALDAAIDAFAGAVVRSAAVDPLTTELVRLRCAQYHDCRLCGSLRSQIAIEQGLDEAVVAKIARYESSDLDEAAKAALRLTDAMVIHPGAVDDGLYAQLRRHFTDTQIAELCLDIMKWSQQKYLVALRLETPRWQGLATLTFDERGKPTIGGPVEADEVQA